MTHEQKRIRGYEAADIIIEELIRDAREKLEPYAKREGKKIDWWWRIALWYMASFQNNQKTQRRLKKQSNEN